MKAADLPFATCSVGLFMATWSTAETGRDITVGETAVAWACGLSARAVREHISFLLNLGLLTRVRGHGRAYETNEYQLSWPADVRLIRNRLDPKLKVRLVAEPDWCTVQDLRRAKKAGDWAQAFRYGHPDTAPAGTWYWDEDAATPQDPNAAVRNQGAGTADPYRHDGAGTDADAGAGQTSPS